MQVAKWGNSLAVRLPANLVAALGLKEGQEVELHLVGERQFEVSIKASPPENPIPSTEATNSSPHWRGAGARAMHHGP